MGRPRGYGAYRGRGRGNGARAVLVVIIVILLLLIFSFFFLNRFLVYTDSGVRLELPFFQREGEQTPDDGGLVVDSPDPTESVVVESFRPKAVMLPISALADGTARDAVTEAGGTAAVFDMKTDDGMLGYVSGMQEAVNAKTSQSDPMLNAAIAAGNNDSIYTIARISCFRDQMLSTHRLSFSIIGSSGYRWKDSDGVRWISPSSQGATDYLLGVVEELCVLGFDEILLDNCGFPFDEEAHPIRMGETYPTDPDDRTEDMLLFLEAVKAITDRHEVKLSIRTTGAALEGRESETTGLLPSMLLQSCDRLWVDEADIAAGIRYQSPGDRSGVEDDKRLVAVLPAGTELSSVTEESWAVLDAAP